MKIQVNLLSTVLICILLSACQTPPSTIKPGEWADDLEAAKQEAGKTRRPILLNFTGADWCGPCIEMEEKVFSEHKWKAYAADHLVPVAVNISIEEVEDMRQADPKKDVIRIQYDIKGYPTFVLLDNDGETMPGMLGGRRLQAWGEPSPETFIQMLRPHLHYWSVAVEQTASRMKAKDRTRYLELAERRKELMHKVQDIFQGVAQVKRERWYIQAEIRDLEAELKNIEPEEGQKELLARIEQLRGETEHLRELEREKDMPLWSKSIARNLVAAEDEMRAIRVAQLNPTEQANYRELVKEEEEAKRRQRNFEAKMKYYRLEHRRKVY